MVLRVYSERKMGEGGTRERERACNAGQGHCGEREREREKARILLTWLKRLCRLQVRVLDLVEQQPFPVALISDGLVPGVPQIAVPVLLGVEQATVPCLKRHRRRGSGDSAHKSARRRHSIIGRGMGAEKTM